MLEATKGATSTQEGNQGKAASHGDKSPQRNDNARRASKGGEASGHLYGYALTAVGAVTALFFWFVAGSVPMTALGIGIAVLGSSVAITPLSPVPPANVRRMLESSVLNIEALLEEMDVRSRGYYVPQPDGEVQVFAPLDGEAPPAPGAKAEGFVTASDGRRYLVIFPPGSFLMKNAELPADAEGAISELIVDAAGLADSARAIEGGGRVTVEVSSPKAKISAGRVRRTVGSLEASVAATAVAAVMKKTVMIASEEEYNAGRKKRIILELY